MTAVEAAKVLVERRGHVLVLTLNRHKAFCAGADFKAIMRGEALLPPGKASAVRRW